MGKQTEAMKLALEALEELTTSLRTMDDIERGERAITALQEALAEQPAQQAFVGMVKDLFTITAWEKLDVVGSTKVYLNSPPAQRTWVELTEWQPIEMTDEDMYHYTNWISKR